MGERVPLNSLCSKGKSTLRQKDLNTEGLYPVYGASGIIGYMDTYQNEHEYIAVVKDGAGVGRATICSGKSSVLGTMQALLPNEGVECGYLLHLVRTLNLGSGFSGSTIPHIYFKDYGKRLVPSFSLKGQKDISARFDKIESQINLGNRILERCGQLVKSQFVEMFGDPIANPREWPVSTIKETAVAYGDGPFGSNLKSSDYVEDGVRVIRLGNILQGAFSEKDRSFVSFEKYEKLKKYECKPGEVVIATLGDPILRACLVPDFGAPSIHKADCMYYETDKAKVLPAFAMNVINQPAMLQRATEDAHGQTRIRINSTQTGNLPIIVPPIELQNEFCRFVAEVDKSRFVVQRQIEKLRTLYDSLAQEYFG